MPRAEFARHLGVGDGTLANVLAGQRPRSPKLLAALLDAFPEKQHGIQFAYNASDEHQRERHPAEIPETLNFDTGRFGVLSAVKAAIDLQLSQTDEAEQRMELFMALAEAYADHQQDSSALVIDAVTHAFDCAKQAGVPMGELQGFLSKLAFSLTLRGDYSAAHHVLSESLSAEVMQGQLWYLKGFVYWMEHDFVAAYAALTASLDRRFQKDRALYLRGCVLAESAAYEPALVELQRVIDGKTDYEFSASTRCLARAWRAYILAKQKLWKEACEEFDALQGSLEHDPLFLYLEGLSRVENGQVKAGKAALRKALDSATVLSACKIANAEHVLGK
jgi:hypothetical protein